MFLLDLIKSDGITPKQKTASEYSSPCPACGGDDRFIIFAGQGKYWCRGCGKSGDAVQYLRDFRRMSFQDAAALVGKTLPSNRQCGPQPARAARPEKVQPSAWTEKLTGFVEFAHGQLMGNTDALSWLRHERGLTKATAERFKLGWLDTDYYRKKTDWGLPDDDKKLFFPAGLVIPWQSRRARIRRSDPGEFGRYFVVKGSAADPLLVGDPCGAEAAVVVESELDAILLYQEIRRKIFIVSLGSAAVKPDADLLEKLSRCPVVLAALDTDAAGGKASKWWLQSVSNAARTLTPHRYGKDLTEAFLNGLDLGKWFEVSLELAAEKNGTHDADPVPPGKKEPSATAAEVTSQVPEATPGAAGVEKGKRLIGCKAYPTTGTTAGAPAEWCRQAMGEWCGNCPHRDL